MLKSGGRLYTITDVQALGEWHHEKLLAHPLFRELTPSEYVTTPQASDPCVEMMTNTTEEGQKVTRNSGKKYPFVFQRV